MKNKLTILAGAVAALVGITTNVQAVPSAPSIEYSLNGTSWTTITGSGNSVTSGSLTAGTWSITALSGLVQGSASGPILDLDTLNVSGGSGSLYIMLSATGFGPSSGGVLGNLGYNVADAVNWYAYASSANTLFGTGTTLFSVTGLTGSGSASASGSIDLSGPYSLTEEYVITGTTGGSVDSLDGEVKVPDGGSTVMLLGAALSAVGILRKKLVA